MRAMLHDFALMHYTYLRSILDSREPIRAITRVIRSFPETFQRPAVRAFSSRCRGRDRLIENEYRRILPIPPRAPVTDAEWEEV